MILRCSSAPAPRRPPAMTQARFDLSHASSCCPVLTACQLGSRCYWQRAWREMDLVASRKRMPLVTTKVGAGPVCYSSGNMPVRINGDIVNTRAVLWRQRGEETDLGR